MTKKLHLAKHVLSIILCVAIMLGYMPITALAEETVTGGTCGAETNDGGVESVTWSYDAATTILTISGTGAVADYAAGSSRPWIDYIEEITTVVINEGITRIGDRAFLNMTALTGIFIPETVTELGFAAIADCTTLESVSIPGSIKTITEYSISNCTKLKEIRLSEGVEVLEEYAFYGNGIENITIPASVRAIDIDAFSWCDNLQSFTVAEDNSYYYAHDGVLFTSDHELVKYPVAKADTSYTVPEGTIGIGCAAFELCSNILSVELPNTVTYIGDYAFNECTNLTTINIPSGITSIGVSSFSFCRKLTQIDIPNSVTLIGDSAFSDCESLTQIDIPNSVTLIGDSAFSYCESLSRIDIPDSVTSIGDEAFLYCRSLTEVTIPNSVTDIGRDIFSECGILEIVNAPCSWSKYNGNYPCEFSYMTIVLLADHTYGTYSVNDAGDTIIDACTACGDEEGTAQITAAGGEYNGACYEATVEKTGSLANQSFDISYCCDGGCTNIGTHTAKITLGDVEATTTFSITKTTPSVTVTPGLNLVYNDMESPLIENAETTGGIIWYKLDDGEWSTDFPSATNADTYTVYYKVVGGDYFEDVPEQSFEVTIAPDNVDNYADEHISITLEYDTIGYDGTQHTPAVNKLLWGEKILTEGTDFTVAYSSNQNAGDATVSITFIGNYSGTKEKTFEITQADAVYTAPTVNDLIYAGAPQELITAGTTNDGAILYALGINNSVAPEDVWSEDIPTGTNAGDYYVWYKVVGDSNHKNSDVACLVANIGKKLPDITVPTSNDLTFSGIAQNLINAGTASAGEFQYSVDNSNWSTDIPVATNAGTYTVYYKVVGNENYLDIAVDSLSVEIKAKSMAALSISLSQSSYEYDNTAIEPVVTVQDGETTLIKGTDYEVNYENNINAGTATVKVSFKGNYTGTADKTFTIVDTTVPTGTILINENGWTQFWNWVTFGLFFKDTVDVTVTADGTGSEVAKVEYLLSGEVLSNESMPTEGWTTLTENGGNYSFSIQAQNKTAVYIRITDESGNVAIINSDGIVVYEDSEIAQPVLEYIYKEGNDHVLSITARGNTVNRLTDANGVEIDSSYYTVEDDKLTLKAAYLDTLSKGEYTYKIFMNPMGVENTEDPLKYEVKVKVAPKALTVTSVTSTNRPFDGTNVVDITEVVLNGIKDADIVFVDVESLNGTLSNVNAGTYTSVTLPTLTLTGNQAENYTLAQPEGAVSTNVTISKADAEIIVDTSSYDKTYLDAAFTLDVTDTNPEADVQYEVTSGNDVVSVSNETVTILSAGTAIIKVSVPESTNYNATEATTITITVEKAENAPDMPNDTISVPYSNKTVGAVTLPEGWAWQDADKDTELGVGVSVNATAVYTGADKGNYENETVVIAITRSDCKHTNTEVRNAKGATCEHKGYTGDTYCKDCGERTATGSEISLKGHTGGTATCAKKAVCSACGKEYGSLDSSKHGEMEIRGAVEATCTAGGYTGDTHCKDCGVKIASGTTTDRKGHDYTSTVTKEPTTIEEGVMTYTCSACEDTYTEPIDKLPDENSDKPFIKGEDGKTGWGIIRDEVEEEENGNIVTVDMNGATVVPGNVLDDIKGEDINIVFDMGNGITWTVNGKDIKSDKVGDIDFGVKVGEAANNIIPIEVINKISGERNTMNLSLSYDGKFGFEAVLSLNVDAKNAGLYANLYYYNETTGEIEFICADQIAADGTAELTFNHASEYVIILDSKSMEIPDSDEDISTPDSEDTIISDSENVIISNTDDTSNAMIIWWILACVILAILVVLFIKKNKKA